MKTNLKLYRHKAQYYETDQMGVIHHSNYIKWFEEARVDILEQLGMDYAKMEERGIRIPVLSVSCEYKSMVQFGDEVLVIPKIEKFTGVRMTLSYRIIDGYTKELKTTGETRHCFLDSNNRPISIKREHPEIYDLFHRMIGKDITENLL